MPDASVHVTPLRRAATVARCALLASLLAATPAAAQSPPRTVYAAPNPLFFSNADEPLACTPIPPQDWHRGEGIAQQYLFQLPGSRRSGQVGSAADGSARYLLVSYETVSTQGNERYSASLRFSATGRMEVGRQAWELTPATPNPPQVNTTVLRDDEGVAALGFARELLARCRGSSAT